MWAQPDPGMTISGTTYDGMTSLGPCIINCANASEIYAFHPGGANAVFGDGSVRFLTQTTAIGIIAAQATRAGGEAIPNGY